MARNIRAAPASKKKTRSSLAFYQKKEDANQVSKSAQRRRKQREREQLAGNKAGMQELTDMVSMIKSEEAIKPASRQTDSTFKSKREMLRRERQRQPVILADLHQTVNPFAALRTHARNTLDLAPRKPITENDEQMDAS